MCAGIHFKSSVVAYRDKMNVAMSQMNKYIHFGWDPKLLEILILVHIIFCYILYVYAPLNVTLIMIINQNNKNLPYIMLGVKTMCPQPSQCVVPV